jgi:hypothetical protein
MQIRVKDSPRSRKIRHHKSQIVASLNRYVVAYRGGVPSSQLPHWVSKDLHCKRDHRRVPVAVTARNKVVMDKTHSYLVSRERSLAISWLGQFSNCWWETSRKETEEIVFENLGWTMKPY